MTRQVIVGEAVVDLFPLFDFDGYSLKSGETVFTSSLWKNTVPSVIPVTVSEINSSGVYRVSFTPNSEGIWTVNVLANYNKDTWGAEYSAATGNQQDVINKLNRLLGLSHENIFIDNTSYDADTQLVLARVRLFDTKAHCDAATDGGSETDGLIATYQLTTTWEGLNQFQVFKQTLE